MPLPRARHLLKLLRSSAPGAAQTGRRFVPGVVALEERDVPATFTVTNLLDDTNPGSLRWAVGQANTSAGPDVINFALASGSVIPVASQLSVTEDAVTFNGPLGGTVTVNSTAAAGADSRVFFLNLSVPGAAVTMNNLRISGGNVNGSGFGGGIRNQNASLTLNNSVVTGNTAPLGGGVSVYGPSGTLTVTNSTISNNNGTLGAGILTVVSPRVTITNSTVSGNTAGANGGGVYFYSYYGNESLTVTNSTISGNQAGTGGGLNLYGPGSATLTQVTLSGNLATRGGGISVQSGTFNLLVQNSTVTRNTGIGGGVARTLPAQGTGGITLFNSVVAQNNQLAPSPSADVDLNNTAMNASSNLFGVAPNAILNGTGNLFGTAPNPLDAQFGALANNGGTTQTHLPATTSPVRNSGNNLLLPDGLNADQRGQTRVNNRVVDLGAVELPNATPNTTVVSPLTVLEDVPTPLTGIVVTDLDTPDTLTVTVTASAGTLTSTGTNATGSGTGTVVLTALPFDIAASLATLSYTTAPNSVAAATLTINVADSAGGNATQRTITVNVTPVNDPPTFNAPANVSRAEDSGAATLAGFITGFSPGPADESAQTLVQYTVTNDNNALFSVQPSIAANGTLTFTPAANANGVATVTVRAQDSGGTANGGIDTSAPRTFTITITEVNDAPTATNDTSADVFGNSGPNTLAAAPILANDSPGPANESGQTLTITGVTVDTVGAGTATVSPAGNIVFTPTTGFTGAVALTYTVSDNGTSNGAADPQAATATINFTVVAPNTAPVITSNGGGPAAAVSVVGATRRTVGPVAVTTVTATDTRNLGVPLTFALGGPDAARFAINQSTGALTFATNPDFDNPADADRDNVYNVTVTVTNAGVPPLSASQALAVTVTRPFPVPTFDTAEFIAVGADAGTLGVVKVLNAQTRQQVLLLDPFAGFTGGVQVALGDVNGDGREDLIVGTATTNSHVKAFDVRSGVQLASFLAFPGFTGGVTLAAADVDGDRRADVVVGTATASSHVKVFSGATFQEVRSVIAFPGFTNGVNVAAGDLNGDGRAEVVALARRGGDGHIKAFDGATGGLITSFLAYAKYQGDVSVAVGDVNGDGFGEVVTLAQTGLGDTHLKAFGPAAQEVRSFIAPISRANTFVPGTPFRPQEVGSASRLGVADVNGDGIADFLIGSQPGATTSRFVVLDGLTGGSDTRFAFDALFGLGVFVDVK